MQSSLVVLICPCCGQEIKADINLVPAFSISEDDLSELLDQSGYEFGTEGGE